MAETRKNIIKKIKKQIKTTLSKHNKCKEQKKTPNVDYTIPTPNSSLPTTYKY